MAETKRPHNSSKVTMEIEVLDEDTKRRIIECIERRGKITVSMEQKGAKALGNGNGGFAQSVD